MTSDRLDGWKAIGLHFGRDRSTVIRWASQRGMPVHAIPGGKTRTVYALRGELDEWARRHPEEPAAPPPIAPAVPPPAPLARRPRRLAFAASAGVMALGLAGYALDRSAWPAEPARDAAPHDARAAALFVQARDDWAKRSRASLARSIAELNATTRIEPGFAPAYGDLATAYILAQEAGSLPQRAAFAAATRAARQGLGLDPALAPAHRALGFVTYWSDGDRAAADAAMQRALALDDTDALTPFWYANILADRGDDAPAMAAFARARLLDPGSPAIAADLAWANWSAGRDAPARAQLRAVIAADPANVEARDCLGDVLLAGGDTPGFLTQFAARARLQGEATLLADAATLARAWATGGRPAVLRALIAEAGDAVARGDSPDRAELAFLTSLAGDRPALLAVLADADRRHERWGSAGYVRRIEERWAGDRTILDLIHRRLTPASG